MSMSRAQNAWKKCIKTLLLTTKNIEISYLIYLNDLKRYVLACALQSFFELHKQLSYVQGS